jgi:hypothetical protein
MQLRRCICLYNHHNKVIHIKTCQLPTSWSYECRITRVKHDPALRLAQCRLMHGSALLPWLPRHKTNGMLASSLTYARKAGQTLNMLDSLINTVNQLHAVQCRKPTLYSRCDISSCNLTTTHAYHPPLIESIPWTVVTVWFRLMNMSLVQIRLKVGQRTRYNFRHLIDPKLAFKSRWKRMGLCWLVDATSRHTKPIRSTARAVSQQATRMTHITVSSSCIPTWHT